MNIFVTDKDAKVSAINLDDKRLVKMVLETAQLLATAITLNGGKATYKPTHLKHPATIWVCQNKANYSWLFDHFISLLDEYTMRFNKKHKCQDLVKEFTEGISYLPEGSLQQFANCTANKSKNISFKHLEEPTEAYKAYLCARWDTDTRIPKWTNRTKPEWYRGIYA